MSDFLSLGSYEATGSESSITLSGLDTSSCSVLEIWCEFQTDQANACDAIRVNCSSGQGTSGQTPNVSNSGISWAIVDTGYASGIWTSVSHTTNNEILCGAVAANGWYIADRTGFRSHMLVFNPVTNVGGRDRAITIHTDTTFGFGSTMGNQTYGDVNSSVVSWPRPTSSPEASITSFTFSPVYGSNIVAGSWVAVYGYHQE
mgnify:CR=1 FL=1